MYSNMTLPDLFKENTYEHPVWGRRMNNSVPEEQKLTLYKHYCASYIDWCTGKTLRLLDDYGLKDNTIVVYLSEHGDMNYVNGMRGKSCFFEESARVPLIVNIPRSSCKNTEYTGLTELADLFPTFCDAAGLCTPAELPSRSF